MDYIDLSEFKFFSGTISAIGINTEQINFKLKRNDSGKLEVEFDKIYPAPIKIYFENLDTINFFTLSGKLDDGIEFKTDTFYITHPFAEIIKGNCTHGEFQQAIEAPILQPKIHMNLNILKPLKQIKLQSALGMVCIGSDERDDNIFISIKSEEAQTNSSDWMNKANEFIEHIRYLMSFAFAFGEMLRPSQINYYDGKILRAEIFEQNASSTAPHKKLIPNSDLESFLSASIKSFFHPVAKIKSLSFTIEWFTMNSSYIELNLISTMTALENLLEYNLDKKHCINIPKNEYKILKVG